VRTFQVRRELEEVGVGDVSGVLAGADPRQLVEQLVDDGVAEDVIKIDANDASVIGRLCDKSVSWRQNLHGAGTR
jgi:hypothetical protein